MKTLKFSEEFRKLQLDQFTTIRRGMKFKVGEPVRIITPSRRFEGRITGFMRRSIEELSDDSLMRDTDTGSRKEALSLLNSFYSKPIVQEELITVYLINKSEHQSIRLVAEA